MEVNPKTVYNYVMKIRGEYNLPKVTQSDRQYSIVPDLPMGEQAPGRLWTKAASYQYRGVAESLVFCYAFVLQPL